jgi:hypothetical protein
MLQFLVILALQGICMAVPSLAWPWPNPKPCFDWDSTKYMLVSLLTYCRLLVTLTNRLSGLLLEILTPMSKAPWVTPALVSLEAICPINSLLHLRNYFRMT